MCCAPASPTCVRWVSLPDFCVKSSRLSLFFCHFSLPGFLASFSPGNAVMPRSLRATFHPPLHPGVSLLPFFSIFLQGQDSHLCQPLPSACPHATPLLSNQLQSGFCLNCCSEITYVKATNLLLTSTPDRHFSVLLLFRLPGTFGIIFFLDTEEASTAGYLSGSSLLSLRPLCQLLPTLENSLFPSNHPVSLLFIPCTFLSARLGSFTLLKRFPLCIS